LCWGIISGCILTLWFQSHLHLHLLCPAPVCVPETMSSCASCSIALSRSGSMLVPSSTCIRQTVRHARHTRLLCRTRCTQVVGWGMCRPGGGWCWYWYIPAVGHNVVVVVMLTWRLWGLGCRSIAFVCVPFKFGVGGWGTVRVCLFVLSTGIVLVLWVCAYLPPLGILPSSSLLVSRTF